MQKKKPTPDASQRWNIVTGDKVRVIQGPQEGQEGKVLAVLRKKNLVIVENVNMRRRIEKPKSPGDPRKISIKPCSVHYSNVMLIDPTTGEPTKISRRFLEDGTKVRVSKATGHIIPKPDPLENRKLRSTVAGPKDTATEDVFEVTFDEYEKYLPHIYERWQE
eukprot:CAMPEP_0185025362 /NCGR_PEP_ID=MMETSP1103-20130426/8353_1 /TAXON_ID=36769 /ORGANISM="Paraphysomonas bandaiensis, Strain Caron Lab Isolate" /LENGTH=162 /DNA_ID=CAMNT_0027558551 /DNA_START=153 /DNA_END=641 /DNA_ORIENTATION=+